MFKIKPIRVLTAILVGLLIFTMAYAGGLIIEQYATRDTGGTIDIMVYNDSGAGVTLAKGDCVAYKTTSGKYGVAVSTNTDGNCTYMAGVMLQSVAYQKYGKCRIFGYCDTIKVTTVVGGGGGSAYEFLGSSTAAKYGAVSTTAAARFAQSYETWTAAGTVKGFVLGILGK